MCNNIFYATQAKQFYVETLVSMIKRAPWKFTTHNSTEHNLRNKEVREVKSFKQLMLIICQKNDTFFEKSEKCQIVDRTHLEKFMHFLAPI